MTLRIATWNVNSLNVRLPHVLDWLAAQAAAGTAIDALCLQETKLVDEKFPADALREAGYAAAFTGQKTYNGVALLTRLASVGEPRDVVLGNPLFPDEQKRLVTATVGEGDAAVRVTCAYFPNGQAPGTDKFDYKMRWLDALHDFIGTQLAAYPRLVLGGDYNITFDARDVHDPAQWEGQIHCTPEERAKLQALCALGLDDAFRLFEQPEKSFSWWDYRQGAFRRNAGLRIDHLLLSKPLSAAATACGIDREPRRREQPSDHTPVVVTLG